MNSLIVSKKHVLSFIDYPSLYKTSLTHFVYGCGFHCPGCQNKELQKRPDKLDDNCLEFKDPNDFVNYLLECDEWENRASKLVVLQGGDPMYKENRDFIRNTIKVSADRSTGLQFCIYTGFQIEVLQDFFTLEGFNIPSYSPSVEYAMDKYMSSVPYIKCGEFDNRYMNETPGKRDGKMYFATKNQKLFKYIPGQLRYELFSKDGIADLTLER